MENINNSEYKEVLNNWHSFTASLEPEFSKLTFFPESILPLSKSLYLAAFRTEFLTHKASGTLNPQLIKSIAINVGNINRFSGLLEKTPHKLYAQKLMENPELIKDHDPYPLLDVYLQQSLAGGLLQFCEENEFPKNRIYSENLLFFSNMLKEGYTTSYFKSLFEDKKVQAPKREEVTSPKELINQSLDKKSSRWMSFFIVSLIWAAVFHFIVGWNKH